MRRASAGQGGRGGRGSLHRGGRKPLRTRSSSPSSATRSRSRARSPRPWAGFRSVNVALRKDRPVRQPPPGKSMKGSQRAYKDVDLVVVRENTEDLYAGIEHTVGPEPLRASRSSRGSSERIVRSRSTTPSPTPPQGHGRPQGQHHEVVRRPVPRERPDVAEEYTARSSSRTASSTTCACSSSRSRTCTTCWCCRTCTATSSATSRGAGGGLGVAPGANIGTGRRCSSRSTDRAQVRGQNKVNPTALMLAGVMMLRDHGKREGAERPEAASPAVIAEGDGHDTTWAGPPDHRVRRRGHRATGRRERGPMTGLPAALRAPHKPRGTAPSGLGATRRRDRWWVAPTRPGHASSRSVRHTCSSAASC